MDSARCTNCSAEHDGDARSARLLKPFEHRFGDQRGQAERHLVGDDQLWRHREGPGQGQHLLLASGQAPGALGAPIAEDRKAVDRPVDRREAVLPGFLSDGHP